MIADNTQINLRSDWLEQCPETVWTLVAVPPGLVSPEEERGWERKERRGGGSEWEEGEREGKGLKKGTMLDTAKLVHQHCKSRIGINSYPHHSHTYSTKRACNYKYRYAASQVVYTEARGDSWPCNDLWHILTTMPITVRLPAVHFLLLPQCMHGTMCHFEGCSRY